MFEREGGFVNPEATVRTHQRLVLEAGAEFRAEAVTSISFGENPFVSVGDAQYRPNSFVVTAGPWAPQLIANRDLNITARRKVLTHFSPTSPNDVGPDALPGFAVSDGRHIYYGFPNLAGQGVKLGQHDGGQDCTPETIDRTVYPGEVKKHAAVLEQFVPSAAGPLVEAYTCLYTMSSDENFIIGPLTDSPNCIVATGCSGHAFKFVPVLGSVIADMVQGLPARFDLDFLSPARFE